MSSGDSLTRPSAALLASDRELVEQLEKAATERWGEEWAISIRRWADGEATIYAEHCLGPVSDDRRKSERLMPTSEGDFACEVVVEQRPVTVSRDVLERGVRPE